MNEPSESTHSAETNTVQETNTVEHSVLEDVLRATSASSDAVDKLNAETRQGFQEVARQLSSFEFSESPVAVALVKVVLAQTLRPGLLDDASTDGVAIDIARTLCEDLTASERLRGLWTKLRSGQ